MVPTLPPDDPEPLAAILGVILYPREDETSRKRARTFTAQFLAKPPRCFHEASHTLETTGVARTERIILLHRSWYWPSSAAEMLIPRYGAPVRVTWSGNTDTFSLVIRILVLGDHPKAAIHDHLKSGHFG